MPARLIERLRSRFPEWLLRYAAAVGSLAALTAFTWAAVHFLGRQHPILYAFLIAVFLIVMLGAAWLGYGPGILVSFLSAFVLPRFSPSPSRSFSSQVLRFAVMLFLSLIVSSIARYRRKREVALRQAAGELETRVRERTEDSRRAFDAAREAEERLRFVLDAAAIGYWDFDLVRNSSTRSFKHDQIFGYAEPIEHWDYETFKANVHPDDRARVDAQFQECLATGGASLDFRIVWTDQSVHWVWEQSRVHRDSGGKPAHISGIILDITERKRAEDALREQAQLLDLAHDAILSIDWDGHIRFWNAGAEQMYGWPREEALGKFSHSLFQTEFPVPRGEIDAQLKAHGHWEGELVHTRRDGSKLRVASRWALVREPDGRPSGMIEINTDVTERRRVEEQLRHTQKLESLGVLAGGVAHDFNNLLTGILGNASLVIDNTPVYHKNYALLEDLTKAAERAADLTRQLLAYAGKGQFVLRTLNLSHLVKEIASLIQTSIPKHAQIRLQLQENLPGIEADAGQLQQIVMNLVINGAEAIGAEGGTVLVRTGVQQVDEEYIATMSSAGELLRPGTYVSLEVHDTGSGMDEETVARIFDPFFTTKFTGRGLGLSAVQGIVRAHRGALKVYSKPAQGTTFKVLFPASVHPQHEPLRYSKRDLAGHGMVLVVDDEEVVRQTAKNTLERYGYRILTAEDGQSALRLYKDNSGDIDAVLLDLTMPVMNGEETLRRLQTLDPKVRVLLTSGYNEVEAVQRFAGKGLAGFIQKPYTATALAEKVKEVVVPGADVQGRNGDDRAATP